MKLIDRLHLDYPFAGARMLRDLLNLRRIQVGCRRVRTLMRRMGIEALYRKPIHQQETPGASDLPVPAEAPESRATQSGLGDGYYLCSNGTGLRLSGCRG